MKLKSILGSVFVFSLLTLIPSPLFAHDDWNYWSSLNIEYKIDPKTRFILNPFLRLRDDFSETYYLASRQGIGVKATPNLDLAVHYLYDEEKNAQGVWVPENRLELQPTLKWEVAGFNLSDRNRFEYRSVDDKEKWRYRNLFKVSRAVTWSGGEWLPYISDEFFYDFKKDEWNQNRFSLGVAKKLSANVTVDVYYMIKSDRTGGDWNETNIIGSSLNLSF